MNTDPLLVIKPLKLGETTVGRALLVYPTWLGKLINSWSITITSQGGESFILDRMWFIPVKNVTLTAKKNCKVFQEVVK